MNRNRWLGFGTCLGLVLPLLTGCYDSREIDETGYMIALGVDQGEREHCLKYTFQFSNPLAVGGGEEEPSGGREGGGEAQEQGGVWDSGNPAVTNVVIEAPDYYIAVNLLHNFMSKQPNLSHIKLIVFSEALAREGVLEHSRLLLQEREVRPNTKLAVARSTAEAFLKGVNPALEANTAKYYELLTEDRTMVYAPMVELREFVDAMNSRTRSPVLPLAEISSSGKKDETGAEEPDGASRPFGGTGSVTFFAGEIPRDSEEKSELIGMAVFRGRKMAGEMNGEEALLYRLLCGEVKTAFVSVPDPDEAEQQLTLQLWMNRRPRSRVDLRSGVPEIRMKAEINANLVGAQLAGSPREYDRLEQYAERLIAQELQKFLERSSREYGADILGLGSAAKRKCLTWQQWEELNWEECYGRAEFDLEVQMKIRRGGTTLPLSIE